MLIFNLFLSISLQIISNLPKSVLAFLQIIEHTDQSMIIYFEDMCDKFIHVLSAAPTIENLQMILPVFQKLSYKLEHWYSKKLEPNFELNKFYDDLYNKNHILSIDEIIELEENLPKIEQHDYENYKPTEYERISEKIIKQLIVTISLVISSGSRIGLNQINKIVKSCLACLGNNPKLLNLIHQLWQPLITCFSKTRDLHLLRICVDMTLLFTNFGRDFLKQRTEIKKKIYKAHSAV